MSTNNKIIDEMIIMPTHDIELANNIKRVCAARIDVISAHQSAIEEIKALGMTKAANQRLTNLFSASNGMGGAFNPTFDGGSGQLTEEEIELYTGLLNLFNSMIAYNQIYKYLIQRCNDFLRDEKLQTISLNRIQHIVYLTILATSLIEEKILSRTKELYKNRGLELTEQQLIDCSLFFESPTLEEVAGALTNMGKTPEYNELFKLFNFKKDRNYLFKSYRPELDQVFLEYSTYVSEVFSLVKKISNRNFADGISNELVEVCSRKFNALSIKSEEMFPRRSGLATQEALRTSFSGNEYYMPPQGEEARFIIGLAIIQSEFARIRLTTSQIRQKIETQIATEAAERERVKKEQEERLKAEQVKKAALEAKKREKAAAKAATATSPSIVSPAPYKSDDLAARKIAEESMLALEKAKLEEEQERTAEKAKKEAEYAALIAQQRIEAQAAKAAAKEVKRELYELSATATIKETETVFTCVAPKKVNTCLSSTNLRLLHDIFDATPDTIDMRFTYKEIEALALDCGAILINGRGNRRTFRFPSFDIDLKDDSASEVIFKMHQPHGNRGHFLLGCYVKNFRNKLIEAGITKETCTKRADQALTPL